MARKCYFTGKQAHIGGSITHRGIAKKNGGIGLQLVKTNKRLFKPNLQPARIRVNGRRKKVLLSAKAIRTGITK